MRRHIIIIGAAAYALLAACSNEPSCNCQDGQTLDCSNPDPVMEDTTDPGEPDADLSDPDVSDPDVSPPDADIADEIVTVECDPAAQTGCDEDEKCTSVIESEDPFTARTDCVADGDVPLSGSCTYEEHGSESWDNCTAGTLCIGGTCDEICGMTPDTCTGGFCTIRSGLFEDRDGVGTCQFTCDPLAQNCPEGQACYLIITSGTAQCATPAFDGVQGDACEYINACRVGYGCLLPDDPVAPTGLTCAFFCDASGGDGPTCADGPGEGFSCVALNDFFSDADVDPAIGMCVDPEVWPGF